MPNLLYTQLTGGIVNGPGGVYASQRYTTWWQSSQTNAISDALAQGCHGIVEMLSASVEQTGFNSGIGALDIPSVSAARLVFRTATGNVSQLVWAMPDPSIYLGDGETVDPTATLVANVIAVVLQYGVSPVGEPLVSYDSGRRVTVPFQPVQLG